MFGIKQEGNENGIVTSTPETKTSTHICKDSTVRGLGLVSLCLSTETSGGTKNKYMHSSNSGVLPDWQFVITYTLIWFQIRIFVLGEYKVRIVHEDNYPTQRLTPNVMYTLITRYPLKVSTNDRNSSAGTVHASVSHQYFSTE